MELRPRVRQFFSVVAGAVACLLLAVAFHAAGWTSPYRSHGYQYSQYLSSCVGWGFAVVWLAVAIALGRLTRTAWPVALGMVAPLPLAALIEILGDSTSHNLLGLEIVLIWIPVVLVAFGAAFLGRRMRLSFGAASSHV
jgi:hypothetical protein